VICDRAIIVELLFLMFLLRFPAKRYIKKKAKRIIKKKPKELSKKKNYK
jgi:hypothetical protein